MSRSLRLTAEMGLLAAVFPGQGAQTVGMGRDVAARFPEARAVLERADRVLGFSLSSLCFDGPEEVLRQTVNTQPAIVAVSVAIWTVLARRGVAAQAAAGHSVGEYAALVAAGVLDLEDALRLVRQRGEFMQACGVSRPSTMAAVLGLPQAGLVPVLAAAAADTGGVVEIANLNAPEQIVVSGDRAAVERTRDLALAAGAKKVVLLSVSAAFHSSLMRPAADRLSAALDQIAFRDARMPVVLNVTAEPETAGPALKAALKRQIVEQVRWHASVRRLAALGCDQFVEAGPGAVLSGLIRKALPGAKVMNAQDEPSLANTLHALGLSQPRSSEGVMS